jgi:hypothetical protein
MPKAVSDSNGCSLPPASRQPQSLETVVTAAKAHDTERAALALRNSIDRKPRHDRDQPGLAVFYDLSVGLIPAQISLSHDVFGVANTAQHAVR